MSAAQSVVPRSAEMMKWYDRHNIISSKLSIRYRKDGVRGVFVDKDTFPFQGIAVIPPNMIIRPEFETLEEMLEVRHKCLL
jgi:hypothetical protein